MEFVKCLRMLDTDQVMKRKADPDKWVYCRLREKANTQLNINYLTVEDQDLYCDDWQIWKINKNDLDDITEELIHE